jgi:hypothetical protein
MAFIPPHPCIHNMPALRLQLQKELYNIVYARYQRQSGEKIMSLIQKNQGLQRLAFPAFSYKGEKYSSIPEGARGADRKIIRIPYQPLDKSLHAEMDAWLEAKADIEREEAVFVMNALSAVLKSTTNINDYIRLLPELLHPHLHYVASLCECQVQSMTDEQVERLLATHGRYINVIRERQLRYLLESP